MSYAFKLIRLMRHVQARNQSRDEF